MVNGTTPFSSQAFDVNALGVFCPYGFAIKVWQTSVPFKVKLMDVLNTVTLSYPKVTTLTCCISLQVYMLAFVTSHTSFYASLALSLWWTAVCDLSPPQEGGLECVHCGRTPSGQGKCSCAAASLWHTNRAFLSAGRVVPMHTALRETGGLHHSSGKFWDQQITVLLPPLTCRHWAAQFSLSLCLSLSLICEFCVSLYLFVTFTGSFYIFLCASLFLRSCYLNCLLL